MNHKTDEAASSFFPDVPRHALVGSHPMINVPQPNGGERPPHVPVSAPDVALQTIPCLATIGGAVGHPDISNEVYEGLKRFGSYVRHQCVPVPGMTYNVETIGIWERDPSDAEAVAARDAALQQLRILDRGGIAFLFTRSFLNRKIGEVFDALPTKSFDGDSTPDPKGPIHITGISFDLRPPNQIVTYIDGTDERPFPDVDFRITVTDPLCINGNGVLACNTTIDLDVDYSGLEALTAVFPPFLIELIAVRLNASAPGSTAADCWAKVLAQNDIPIRGGQNVVITYIDVQVTPDGLVLTAGLPELAPRMPSVGIIGRSSLTDALGEGAAGSTYRVELEDLLDPVHIEWFIDSNLLAAGEGEKLLSRPITFQIAEGTTEVRQLRVIAEDVDHLTAEDELTVKVSSRHRRPGPQP
jgi:hypothetical protein